MARSSENTKAAILAAARERFAVDGYERATIRAVAADARIDPSMVMRYFGSKDGLFAAAAEFDLALPDLAALPRDGLGAALVAHFLARWQSDNALQVLLRTSVTNETAAQRMRTIFAAQLAPHIAALTGDEQAGDEQAGDEQAGDDEQAATRATLIAAQILGMALCRYVLRFPSALAMPDAEIVGWLGPAVQDYLTRRPPAR